MSVSLLLLAVFLLSPAVFLQAQVESFRTSVENTIEISPGSEVSPVSIGINSSVIINLGTNTRFLRGLELEITAPQNWLRYQGSLVMFMYNNITPRTAFGMSDFSGNRIAFEPLPSRLRIIYHIPIRPQHGLRTTTTVTVPSSVVQPVSFPLMFRLMQVSKGLPDEFENMRFNLIVRPILSDEGAVRIVPRFPPQLRDRPFTVLINDNIITNISEEIVLREGENHLIVLSDDYRNISTRFIVERAKVIDLILDLEDITPIIIFEGPQNAQIFLNNTQVRNREPINVDPGTHEVRFHVDDYTVIRTLNIQRGKTYRVSLSVDLTIREED